MNIGHTISGAGHIGLIGWLLLGNVFASEPPPFEMTDVSVISSAEFDAMIASPTSPEAATEVVQPQAPVETPDIPVTEEQPVETPPEEPAPQVVEDIPLPPADISDQAPELPEPPAEIAVLTPEVADTPVPKPAERVAPEAVAAPEPEAQPDEVEQAAVTPEAGGETQAEPAEATAPEEAATEIVTEAERPAAAPQQSPRPPARPRPPAAVAEAPAETPTETPAEPVAEAPEPETSVTDDAVNSALAEALGEAPAAPAAPTGPPLTGSEKEGLRVAVSSCWNVGSLSSAALQTTVVVTVSMGQDAKPITSSIRMASSSGGSDSAAGQAFEAARRAIIRCGAKGFDLPVEKYSQWQDIEMTFNPERMRIK